MKNNIQYFYVLLLIFPCNGVSWRRQLEHIAESKLQSLGLQSEDFFPSRRFYQFDPRELSSIIGVPSRPSHLPEAEPILPGHTLLKPTLGMLKSSLKFPHKEMENGAGVYGNSNNLGIKYDSRNERLLYSGFRRFPSDYIMVVPSKRSKYKKSRFTVVPVVLDLEQKERARSNLQKILKRLNIHKGANILVAGLEGGDLYEPVKERSSYYLGLNELDRPKLYKQMLRTNKDNDDDADINAELEEVTTTKPPPSSTDKGLEKIKWLLNSKNRYNNIKINQDAPDIADIQPEVDQIRQWWFYNAEDYTPFNE